MTTPFCDWLNVSVPYDQCMTVLDDVLPLLDQLAAQKDDGESGPLGTWRLPFGVYKATRRGKVCVLSASGQMLTSLRAMAIFDDYLRALASGPHRVSLMHATLDVFDDAPPVIDAVYQKALAGGVSLTRKAVAPQAIKRYWGPGKDGRETGTVYLGHRGNADVWAKVYDKRQERLDRGFPDPGPTVRYEVCIKGDAGPSLRDAQDPTAIFYHFASPALIERPANAPTWQSGAEGLVLPPRSVSPASARLKSLVESNPSFDRAVRLALEAGPHGMAFLQSLLESKAKALAVEPAAQAA